MHNPVNWMLSKDSEGRILLTCQHADLTTKMLRKDDRLMLVSHRIRSDLREKHPGLKHPPCELLANGAGHKEDNDSIRIRITPGLGPISRKIGVQADATIPLYDIYQHCMKDKAPEEGAELEWTDTRIETKIIIAHGKNSKKRMGSPTSSNDDAERLEVAAEAAAETTKENQTSPKRIRIKDASHSEREVEAAHILCTLAPLPPLPCTFFMTTVGAHPPLDKTTPHLFF